VITAVLTTVLMLQTPTPSAAADSVRGAQLLDSLITAHALTIEWSDGRLGGPGMQWLIAETADAQFVCLGEEHNTQEIPELTTALFRSLQSTHDFRFVALEQDPVSMRLASRAPLRGRRDSLFATSRRDPHRYTFISDQELAMIADIGGASRGKGEPIWGCDQSFGVGHALDRLAAITKNPVVRRRIAAWRDTARAHESVRDLEKYHYMTDTLGWLGDLRRTVRPAAGSEADFLITCLETSHRLYRHYREGRYYLNGYERELYMKQRFMEQYRLAERSDGSAPRVLLKFGHWHLFRGLGPSYLQTLGNFVSEFAIANGRTALTIGLLPHGGAGAYGDLSKWSDAAPALLARTIPRDRWTLVDLRPLRARLSEVTRGVPATGRASFVRWVNGFDVAWFIGGAHRATYDVNPSVPY
jgi:hypothetical protein